MDASFAYKAGKKTNLKLVIMSDSPMSEIYFPVNMMKDGWARYSAFLGRIYVVVYLPIEYRIFMKMQ